MNQLKYFATNVRKTAKITTNDSKTKPKSKRNNVLVFFLLKCNGQSIENAAKNQLTKNPHDTVSYAKRLIAREFDKSWSFLVVDVDEKLEIQPI